ncbi:MAG: outer membrane protein assembly factor BamD [Acidobacteriota bacterium]
MSRNVLGICLLTVAISLAGCGGAKDKVANDGEARPGRDKELYEDAMKKLRKGRYDESRLLFNVVITTYPDSEFLPLAKLAIADSFYREGGSSALEQAIGGYKDFAQYFPTHKLNCAVKLKIAHAYMRQMNAFNRDADPARRAEFQLQATLQSCQTSDLKPEIEANLQQVQQVLGLHELDVARFYFHSRQAYKSAEGRLSEIVKNYPYFTYRDEALFLLGVSRIEQEQPEEATTAFTDLLRDIPNSEYAPKAKEYLEKLGRPIPEAASSAGAPERPGVMGRIGLILGKNDLTISEDGVLISAQGDAKDEASKVSEKPAGVNSATGSVRARVLNSNSNQPAAEATPTSPPAASSEKKPAQPDTTQAATSSQSTSESQKKKDEKKDGKKDGKKKKGFLGILK